MDKVISETHSSWLFRFPSFLLALAVIVTFSDASVQWPRRLSHRGYLPSSAISSETLDDEAELPSDEVGGEGGT